MTLSRLAASCPEADTRQQALHGPEPMNLATHTPLKLRDLLSEFIVDTPERKPHMQMRRLPVPVTNQIEPVAVETVLIEFDRRPHYMRCIEPLYQLEARSGELLNTGRCVDRKPGIKRVNLVRRGNIGDWSVVVEDRRFLETCR